MLPVDLLEDLRSLAEDNDWSVSEAVRRGARSLVAKLKPKKMSGVEFLQKLADNAFEGEAPRDLSSNDEYLYGKLAPDYKGKK